MLLKLQFPKNIELNVDTKFSQRQWQAGHLAGSVLIKW
jgi:hypothetical protein